MNTEATEASTDVALIPESTDLPKIYREGEIDTIIERIRKEVLSVAPDVTTAKGRKEIASLAHKVARSKTALDAAGKELTEEARKIIDSVNEERRKVRDRLDELKAEVRKPLEDWEEKEAIRKADLQVRMKAFALDRTNHSMTSDAIMEVINEVVQITIDGTFQEFEEIAESAQNEALEKYRSDLEVVNKREADEAELNRLRAEAKEREEREAKEREQREAAERAEREERQAKERKLQYQKENARRLMNYIKSCGEGVIDSQPQAFGILIHELESKVPPEIDAEKVGDHVETLEMARVTALDRVKSMMERQSEEREAREAKERSEAEARARKEAAEQERRKAEQERREAEARARDEEHREKVLADIAGALKGVKKDDIPQALLDGKVPHVTVSL